MSASQPAPRPKYAVKRCMLCLEFKDLTEANFPRRGEKGREMEWKAHCRTCRNREDNKRVRATRRAAMAEEFQTNRPAKKICPECCDLPYRVNDIKCKVCGLRFEHDNAPTVFKQRSEPIPFEPPPEERPKHRGTVASLNEGDVVCGWTVCSLLGVMVNLQHEQCGCYRTVSRRHVMNARIGSVRLVCRKCLPDFNRMENRIGARSSCEGRKEPEKAKNG